MGRASDPLAPSGGKLADPQARGLATEVLKKLLKDYSDIKKSWWF
jgi:hypothetical protein